MRRFTLRHRLKLRSKGTATRNDYGEEIPGADSDVTVYADVRALAGREYEHARQVGDETTHEVTIRYRTGVDNTKEFVFDGSVLEIESFRVEPRGVKKWIVCRCKEQNPST